MWKQAKAGFMGAGRAATVGLLSLGLAACGGGGDGKANEVRLSVSVPTSAAGALSAGISAVPGAGGLTLSDGTNTLLITSAEVMVAEIEFERTDATEDCGASEDVSGEDDSNDDCEKFTVKPFLLALPLDGGVDHQIAATVAPGEYDEIEIEIDDLDDEDPLHAELLAANPAFDEISARVVGTFNGAPFVFEAKVDFEQELELATPLVVGADSTGVDVTLAIDLAAWFTNGSSLVNPASAEDFIESNIDHSFECFEDEDHDGEDDEDESSDDDA